MKKSAGFTLVEFIIVLVMIGILGIIAIPIYKSRAVKNEALKVDSYEKMQSQETPLEESLEDYLQGSDGAVLVNEKRD
ncbi:MAG: prepilin-type N-terminal cleavage/methylation domain-containing protein [Endomicrobium sp.]|jgi:prepilin-type N-terminal cleavage/methylation domain-containing protein|nr:prepilin-type N-terminal cleavage/methylation domain-containing protein [Endomicrobium sp.]